MALIITLAVLGVVALAVLLIYNRMVARRNAVDNSWGQIEAALQRRHDLIPNLVEAVKGYAKHEQTTFENVTKARTTATRAKAPPSQAAAEDTLTEAIGKLMVVAEQYPELRATENFQQLQASLNETEDQIQITRRVYNDTVQTYNTFIQIFPPSVLANMFGFQPRQFFDAKAEDEAVPDVSFGGDGKAGDKAAGEKAAPAKGGGSKK